MGYSHLSIVERGQLEALHRLDWSAREISRQLNPHHSTIAREIKRSYLNALPAQRAYQQRRFSSVPTGKFTALLAEEL